LMCGDVRFSGTPHYTHYILENVINRHTDIPNMLGVRKEINITYTPNILLTILLSEIRCKYEQNAITDKL